jgi:hypothetical protein
MRLRAEALLAMGCLIKPGKEKGEKSPREGG